jgi:hypothetical protein
MVTAQDCAFYYPKQEGATLEITNYNRKDKVTGKTIQKITSLDQSGNSMTATVELASYDKKDNLLFESEMDVKCEDNVFQISMENYMNNESMQAFKDADVTVESDNLRYPADMKVGQELNDGTIKISVGSGGMAVMNMTTTIDNRKVEAKENITTPAGTFECYKITYDMTTKMMISSTFKSVEWISMDAGVVKSESYNSKDKLMGYSLLTGLEK